MPAEVGAPSELCHEFAMVILHWARSGLRSSYVVENAPLCTRPGG
jgi:hypothetical protein